MVPDPLQIQCTFTLDETARAFISMSDNVDAMYRLLLYPLVKSDEQNAIKLASALGQSIVSDPRLSFTVYDSYLPRAPQRSRSPTLLPSPLSYPSSPRPTPLKEVSSPSWARSVWPGGSTQTEYSSSAFGGQLTRLRSPKPGSAGCTGFSSRNGEYYSIPFTTKNATFFRA